MNRSRRERRAYNEGKQAGYADGYKQGLHDGNPFIAIAECVSKVCADLAERANDPEFIEAIKKAQKSESVFDTLEIEEGNDND